MKKFFKISLMFVLIILALTNQGGFKIDFDNLKCNIEISNIEQNEKSFNIKNKCYVENEHNTNDEKIVNVQNSNFPTSSSFKVYKYTGEVPHFFTHEIINNPDRAFSSKLKVHFDKDCITHNEFENFLNQMYQNGYALIDIYDYIGFENGKPYFKEIYMPFNKKPFLLSFDDMSYDSTGLGISDKVILDENGNFASFTEKNLKKCEYDKDFVNILENFIETHSDFSVHNARAIICPTGYNGLLGYRINKSSEKDRESEISSLLPVVEKLKSKNYHFASHTYGHLQVRYIDSDTLFKDCKKYDDEILSVIGKTDIFCFPCGSKITSGYKLEILKQFGFKIFFCVGDSKTEIKNSCVFLNRKVLNGVSLRNCQKEYINYFDTEKVYDHEKRTIKF